ncbi:MAG TPA: R3H domain-containing nucleic acid-binding protein [Patescibacteria group bacterium]
MAKATKSKKPKKQSLKDIEIVENLTKELFEKVDPQASVTISQVEDDSYLIDINSNDAGILIGHHGSVLESLRLIISLMFFTKTGKWIQIALDVNGWQDRRNQTLIDKANELAQRVIETGEPVTLSNLNGRERRVVHMALSENNEVATESFGEDEDRKLVIKPASQNAS